MSDIADRLRLSVTKGHEPSDQDAIDALTEIERLREGLDAAIRAAKLALFVINKQGVMPNSSWESGFNSDVAKAVAARDSFRPMPQQNHTGGK